MKTILAIFLLLFFLNATAQEAADTKAIPPAKNEVRLNLIGIVAGMPQVCYERYLPNNTSFGISAFTFIDSENSEFTIWALMPSYRIYFGQKKATGFFIEGNLMGIMEKKYDYLYDYNSSGYGTYLQQKIDRGFVNSYGFGVTIGDKIITKSGFTGEFFLGVDRLYGQGTEYYPLIGISLGKRF